MGGIEHAQRILLSGVKASLYDIKQHKGEFMCCKLEALNAMGGAEHAYFCTLVIVDGAEHAQTFNFWTALAMMTSNSPSFQESN